MTRRKETSITRFARYSWQPHGFYCPIVVSRIQDGARLRAATSGFGTEQYYQLDLVPLDLDPEPRS